MKNNVKPQQTPLGLGQFEVVDYGKIVPEDVWGPHFAISAFKVRGMHFFGVFWLILTTCKLLKIAKIWYEKNFFCIKNKIVSLVHGII